MTRRVSGSWYELRGAPAPSLAAAALLGCAWSEPSLPVMGYESGDLACSDGLDNDADGRVDCADDDCALGSPRCGALHPSGFAALPIEAPLRLTPRGPVLSHLLVAVCTDRIDNDGDGRLDCAAPGCRKVPELCCGTELDDVSCGNGLDDDGDGLVDCADVGCQTSSLALRCDERTPKSCADQVDNDHDGLVDCLDPSCRHTLLCADAAPALVDAPPTAAETTVAHCRDGLDNDGDGFIDCDDYDCSRSPQSEVQSLCSRASEADLAACANGIDDDGDGYVDCDDFSCRDPSRPDLCALCQESAPEVRGQLVLLPDERCADGLDNDRDGFVDCDDWDCSFNELVTVCPGPPPGRCGSEQLDPPPSCARSNGPRICP